jgi:outer membrane protein assembly factor BamB
MTRGDAKSDQAWGVDTDSQGNVYIAAYMQQPPSRLFFDMVIYKFSPDGKELWQTQWGGDLQEKVFIVTVSEPYLYVGGLTHTAMALTEADMAVLALDMNSGKILWEFTWGQGFGYEEVDGLVVDGDYIYVSGWTTGEETSGDMAVLKLDRKGNLIWVTTWGTEGFDEADGQMVVDEDTI